MLLWKLLPSKYSLCKMTTFKTFVGTKSKYTKIGPIVNENGEILIDNIRNAKEFS